MLRLLLMNPTEEEARDPYYYIQVAQIWFGLVFLAWVFSPFFPWK